MNRATAVTRGTVELIRSKMTSRIGRVVAAYPIIFAFEPVLLLLLLLAIMSNNGCILVDSAVPPHAIATNNDTNRSVDENNQTIFFRMLNGKVCCSVFLNRMLIFIEGIVPSPQCTSFD
jgi:hypothetical protein